ncbi:alpha-amylase family glycosyl hydrolase [Saprospiraceae bacterium]|nr:alpha-amylase family glycosyl hydrolase [Saprospiraceae bacterium]
MKLCLTIFILFICSFSFAQDLMMQGWYWDYPKTAAGENWSDTLDSKVVDLGEAGFTHLWLPPLSRASFGSNSNGYDPQDLYDLGEYGLGATGFSTRAQLDALIGKLGMNGIEAVGDVVYNHRDGGKAENNPAVEGWMENLDCTKISSGDQAYPSDRVRFVLPIGGSTGNGAGTYYIKVASSSKHPNFYDLPYKFYAETNVVGYQNMPAIDEGEGSGNGGGDCGQGNIAINLGIDVNSTIDNVGSCGGGCGVDEYALAVSASDFNAAGDSIYVYMTNSAGYSDHFIYGIWNGSADVQADLLYQTYTDFTSMPSGQGSMNYTNFKPNGNPTNLGGDWDSPLFFYDYDQNVTSTSQALIDWSQWLWDDVGVRGFRMDAVKHFDPAFVGALMDSLHNVGQDPSMMVGEFFDFNAGALKAWVDNVKANTDAATDASIDVKIFDFALREAAKNACDLFGYDARNLFTSGVVGAASGAPENVVTFVNNHDFRGAGEPVQNDPLLAYAYILTNRQAGTPTVYYPDYTGTTIPNAPTQEMQTDIDRIIETYNNWMEGGTYDNISRIGTPYSITYNGGFASTSVIFQTIDGGVDGVSDGIVAINFSADTMDVEFPISSSSSKVAGTIFHETTGKGLIPIAVTSGTNMIRIAVPPRSYGLWVSSDVNSNCVSDSLIYVDINASGLNNGSSWTDAFTDLGAALEHANFCPTVEEVWIKEGTYLPNILDDRDNGYVLASGLIVRGGFPSAGNPTIADYDPVANPVNMSGDVGVVNDNADNTYTVVSFNPIDTISLYGINIVGGSATGALEAQKVGGGVVNNFTGYMKDCTITNCSATTSGNAIYTGSTGMLILENCTIENNSGSSTEVFMDGSSTVISIGTTIKD